MSGLLGRKNDYLYMLLWHIVTFLRPRVILNAAEWRIYTHTHTHIYIYLYICVTKLSIIGSNNGLSPVRCQAIIWTNAGILLIEPLGTNWSIFIDENAFQNVICEMASILSRPQCVNVILAKPPLKYVSNYLSQFHVDVHPNPCDESNIGFVYLLNHWGRNKMAAKFHATFSNVFCWMKIYKFRIRFHWKFFPMVQSTIFYHWFR